MLALTTPLAALGAGRATIQHIGQAAYTAEWARNTAADERGTCADGPGESERGECEGMVERGREGANMYMTGQGPLML